MVHRIDNPSAATTRPTPKAPGAPGYFTNGNAPTGTEATIVEADFLNMVQEELANVVTASGTALVKTDNTQLLAALRKLFLTRTLVTADTTIYVSTTGSDSNSGLTAGAPLLTLQAAINKVFNAFDWNGFGCTIQLANGTYNFSVTDQPAGGVAGTAFGMPYNGLAIRGNAATPGSVVINATNATCFTIWGGYCFLGGLTFRASGSPSPQGFGVFIQQGGYVQFQNCAFGPCGTAQVAVASGGVAQLLNGISFTGATPLALWADIASNISMLGQTFTVSGLACSIAFAQALTGGVIGCSSDAFIGTATGSRYRAFANGLIITGGGGANYLPGDAPGTTGTQGQYL